MAESRFAIGARCCRSWPAAACCHQSPHSPVAAAGPWVFSPSWQGQSSGSGNGSTGQTAPVSPVAASVNVAPNPVDEGTPVTVTANLPELVTAGSPVEKTVTIRCGSRTSHQNQNCVTLEGREAFALSFGLTRQESINNDGAAPEHGVQLELNTRF